MNMTGFFLKQRNFRFVLLSNVVFLKEYSDPEHTSTPPKTLLTFVCIYDGKRAKLCSYFKVWGGVWFFRCWGLFVWLLGFFYLGLRFFGFDFSFFIFFFWMSIQLLKWITTYKGYHVRQENIHFLSSVII